MSRVRRAPRALGPRLALAAVVVSIAGFGILDALANVVAVGNPSAAHTLAPWNSRILARAAEQSFATMPKAQLDSRPALLAKKALRGDGTSTRAVNTLALIAQLSGDKQRTRDLFTYSLALSRRDFSARVWAIEDAVLRGDIAGALANYDIALRTSSDAPNVLFPILASALKEPLVRAELLKLASTEPRWLADFMDIATRRDESANDTLVFLDEAAGKRIDLPLDRSDRDGLVDALIVARNYDGAWRTYASQRPKIAKDRSRDPSFAKISALPTVFDWRINEYGSGQADGQVHYLEYSAPPTTGGVVAQQYQLLPPGRYVIETVFDSNSGAAGSNFAPYWSLTCTDGRELVRLELVQRGERTVRRQTFGVSSDCPFQMLGLTVRPSNGTTWAEGRVHSLAIRPVAEN